MVEHEFSAVSFSSCTNSDEGFADHSVYVYSFWGQFERKKRTFSLKMVHLVFAFNIIQTR